MAKRKFDRLYFIVPSSSALVHQSYANAVESAKEECSISGEDFYILEVVKMSQVSIPQEPEPEVSECDLEEVL